MSELLATLITDRERREALRADDMRAMTGSGYRWPEVDKRLMGGVGASLNGWPGNQGTRQPVACPRERAARWVKYRENSGADDSRERPAPIRWPEVDKHTHPAKHCRPSVERRTGPRSTSYWGGLAE